MRTLCIVGICALLAACGGGNNGTGDAGDVAPVDSTADGAVDVPHVDVLDAGHDAAADGALDVAADRSDAGDVASDVTGTDVTPESGLDVLSDVPVDVAVDTTPLDTATDVTPLDAPVDVTPTDVPVTETGTDTGRCSTSCLGVTCPGHQICCPPIILGGCATCMTGSICPG